jgi:SNF2 family DNA or RNA helicase/HJR/Mrr/RecB family endonuclease
MIFNHTYNNISFSFFIQNNEGYRITVSNWDDANNDFLAQLSILYELHENGSADFTNDTCEVETLEILKQSKISKQILGLPDEYPFEIYIQSDGQLNQNSFKFKYGFYDFAPNGTRFRAKRKGALINIEDTEYLLSENQYLICEALDIFNNLPETERTFQNNLKRFADIKAISKSAALTLDSYLNSQEVFCPDKIKIDVHFNDGKLEIIPNLKIENEVGFVNTFDKFPNILESYPVSDGAGTTTRIVISKKQKEELQRIKGIRKIENPQTIQQIADNPELFFDADETDFTVFYSERVKEIGIYKPKFYPFVCPYKSEWIPGIEIRDKVHGTTRLSIKTPEILDAFIEQKKIAVKSGKTTVTWEGIEIPIDEADKLINTAKKQFENPKEPVTPGQGNVENEVLIIKENAEITEFIQNTNSPENLIHSFSKIDNLFSGIDLKTHQVEGISWLQTLHKENLSGCLLADDMGLGKTLQLLYFIEWHSQVYMENKPYLIVAPVSLLENWENEYQKFFSPQNLSLTKLYGSANLTKAFDQIQNQREAQELQRQHIILTNYETLRSYQATLCLVDFAVVVLDEAQKIKTPGTLVTNASKALKADFRIAMTGTPVENTLVDIWCIIDFAVPGLLGNAKDFAKEFQNPLKDEDTDIKELTERLRYKIGIFIKRRLKKDVAKDLPAKHDNINSRIKKVMPDVQLERYKIEIENANNSELSGVDGRNQKLKSLWAIRDISDHPYLLDNQILNFTSEELIATSAKLQTTIGILADIKAKNDKVIVFADRKETQKMLQKVVYDTFGVFSSIINGDTPSSKQRENAAKQSRQQTIDRFQSESGFNVIIMSPLAAGVGLNVTEANHIIHYSRHWNPAKEEQATDRAYRIGQQKDVYVYYPMAVFPDDMKNEKGEKLKSFDEILDNLLNNKKVLASNTLFPTEQAEVRPDELFGNIFGFEPDTKNEALTIQQIDKLNPNLFEAAIAALYKLQGFDVHLTPYSNDKGVDVVLLGDNESFLIQVKQTKTLVGREAIQEIYTAKKYYENIFNVKFNLRVVTNNGYSSTVTMLAQSNFVELVNRQQLIKMIDRYQISIKEINKIELQRMQKI